MVHTITIAKEYTNTGLFSCHMIGFASAFQFCLGSVVVLDGCDLFINRSVEIVVEVTAEGRNPRQPPSHTFLERLNLGKRCSGNGNKRRIASVQVRQMRDAIEHV